jgi:hypothetical protein
MLMAQQGEELPAGRPVPGSLFNAPGQPLQQYPDTDFGGPYSMDAPCTGDCCVCPGGWASVDYLLWWSKGQSAPPLVTTSPQGTDAGDAGVLGLGTASVLFGGDTISSGVQSGGRVNFGRWLDCDEELGLGGKFFGLADATTNFSRTSDGDPILARPFFNIDTPGEDAVLVAFPGVATGTVAVNATSTVLGAEAYLRKLVYRDCDCRYDLLAGYQFARIDESLRVTSSITSIDPNGDVPVGTVINAKDLFRTQNQFNGTEIGFLRTANRGCWSTTALCKLGVGMMRESVIVTGRTIVSVPDEAADIRAGGLLAQPSNIGTQTHDALVLVPELGFNLAYHVTCNFDLLVGYSFIYWTSVVQPGPQIDRVVSVPDANGTQANPNPAPRFHETDYWVQGINFGAQWRW